MSTTVEIRLPRSIAISLGRLDDGKLGEVRTAIAEAEKAGHGLLLAEHKRMQMVEANGITSGRIAADLVLIQAADPAATLVRYKTNPPDGIQVVALIPAGMLGKAVIATLSSEEPEPAKL